MAVAMAKGGRRGKKSTLNVPGGKGTAGGG